MELELKGKTALVCASSQGLGYAVAAALAAEGVTLLLNARNKDKLNAAAAHLRSLYNVPVETHACDLTQPQGRDELAQAAKSRFGTVDILINNIGGPAPTAARETSEESWRQGFEQLFLSNTQLTAMLLPAMQAQHFGRIITITSLSVVEPIEHLAVSTAMRAAVTAYSKNLATELAASGVTVNTVMPGVIHTQRIEDLRRAKAARVGSSLEAEMANTARQIPAQRLGRPEELAALVCFLASPKASYITGTNIPVDGGLRRGWT